VLWDNEMDRFASHFFQLGYKRASAKIHISRLARFSEFAAGVSATGPITQEVVDLFLRGFPTASHPSSGERFRGHGLSLRLAF